MRHMKRYALRGAALITSLWIAVILLILGTAFLSLMESDYRYAARQEDKAKTFYLARAGMEYMAAQRALPPADPVTGEFRVYLPARSRTHYCVIAPDAATGKCVYKGTIARENGRVVMRTCLVCPQGDIFTWYERKE